MSQYILLLYQDEAGFWFKLTEGEREQWMAAYSAYTAGLTEAGVFTGANRFRPYYSAMTVRIAHGKLETVKGPYADLKEQLGGYYIIDVADLDAAISWAVRCPAASHGVIEVRPLRGLPA